MIILAIIILIYSIIYLTVYVLAHQDANMIKPLTAMTVGMIFLLVFTAIIALVTDRWYISLICAFLVIGLINFFMYLTKY